jgi:hypothetical protein
MVAFHDAAITPACQRGLDYLRHQGFLDDFYLNGGTALALQIGHRISTDLDWFSTTRRLPAPEREQMRLALSDGGEFEVVSEQEGMLFTRLFGADDSLIVEFVGPFSWPGGPGAGDADAGGSKRGAWAASD